MFGNSKLGSAVRGRDGRAITALSAKELVEQNPDSERGHCCGDSGGGLVHPSAGSAVNLGQTSRTRAGYSALASARMKTLGRWVTEPLSDARQHATLRPSWVVRSCYPKSA